MSTARRRTRASWTTCRGRTTSGCTWRTLPAPMTTATKEKARRDCGGLLSDHELRSLVLRARSRRGLAQRLLGWRNVRIVLLDRSHQLARGVLVVRGGLGQCDLRGGPHVVSELSVRATPRLVEVLECVEA